MNNDFSLVINGICQVLADWEPVLLALPDDVITHRRNKQNRTIRQLIGHLIDSASNNHQRMVRLQYNKQLVFPDYTQHNDVWIAIQHYQEADFPTLVQFWKAYNLHIVRIMQSVDTTALSNYWTDFEGHKVTLKDMINGYLSHLQLHMAEIKEIIG